MQERLSVKEAAQILGVNEQSVREHMKRGLWDIGYVDLHKGRKTYYIWRSKLERMVGKDG